MASPDQSLSSVMALAYREHHQSLVAFLNFKLQSMSEANDIAQEAYARILRHGLPGDIRCVRAYVFRTANNLAINKLIDRQRKRKHLPLDEYGLHLPSNQLTPEECALCEDDLRVIAKAVEELPDKCRMAFVLYKFELLGYGEIAERMQLTESMIRKYVLKGIRHCKKRLDEQ